MSNYTPIVIPRDVSNFSFTFEEEHRAEYQVETFLYFFLFFLCTLYLFLIITIVILLLQIITIITIAVYSIPEIWRFPRPTRKYRPTFVRRESAPALFAR